VISSSLIRPNRITKTGKIKIGHGVMVDSTRSKAKIIIEDKMKNFVRVIDITTPSHELRFGL